MSDSSLAASFEQSLYGLQPSYPCGVAVSGGGDSVSMFHLLLETVGADNIIVLHFNHNLREGAAAEQKFVEELAAKHGVKCVSQVWETPSREGNLQQQGRWARYGFFAAACKEYGLSQVFLGHTRDDVAETMLMRLGRGSGLKGLAAMREKSTVGSVQILRPLLGFSRQELRDYLTSNGHSWCDDPSNENESFHRVRVRRLKESLAEAGISFESIVASAHSLRRAEAAVQTAVSNFRRRYTKETSNGKLEVHNSLLKQPEEVALQVLEEMILQVKPAAFAPRTTKRERALDKMRLGQLPYSLGGITIAEAENGFSISVQASKK